MELYPYSSERRNCQHSSVLSKRNVNKHIFGKRKTEGICCHQMYTTRNAKGTFSRLKVNDTRVRIRSLRVNDEHQKW